MIEVKHINYKINKLKYINLKKKKKITGIPKVEARKRKTRSRIINERNNIKARSRKNTKITRKRKRKKEVIR
jgi:hypothetical protein